MDDKIRLGISACLLGEKVRFDGGHKLDRFLVNTLGAYVEWVPVCPEVEIGLPTPREALRLVAGEGGERLVFQKSGEDLTGRMWQWARKRCTELESENLCGFVFKSRSPSSGMERVKLYNAKGVASKDGVGLFARAFMEYFPLLPVEEEGRLHDPKLRETFIEAIFTLKRWRGALSAGLTPGGLVDFHTRHKLLLLSHSPEFYRQMGKLVAQAGSGRFDVTVAAYQQLLLQALRLGTTVKKQVNVLQHLLGYFKRQLSAAEKAEMLGIMERYRDGLLPLIVPITLLGHFIAKYDQEYLKQQVYLSPHPVELALRNHV